MRRVNIIYNEDVIPITQLTSRMLVRTGKTIALLEDGAQEDGVKDEIQTNGSHRLDWEEAVAIKQRLLEGWDHLHSEQILDELDHLWVEKESDVTKLDLRQTPDLWLLKALAQEKSVYTDIVEIESTYHHCRHLGNWNGVLVRNNLAVLQARRQECAPALVLFTEAIQMALAYRLNIKAPFYNCALMFQQLHKNRVIFQSRYLDHLDELTQLLALAAQNAEPESLLYFQKSSAKMSWAEQEIESAYKHIAHCGYRLADNGNGDLFHHSATHLVPYLDLFASFGDVATKIDTRSAHELFEKGINYLDEGKFAEGLINFEMASQMDPTFSPEAAKKAEQATDEWRFKQNQTIIKLLQEKDYDEATRVLISLPDERLRRASDNKVASTIRKLKHRSLLQDADHLSDQGKEPEARTLYIRLLKEEDIEDQLRMHVSNKLAESVKRITDDEERYNDLNELILYGAHPQVVGLLSAEIEKNLISQGIACVEEEKFELAIRKYFWALFLPGRSEKREELMQLALFAFDSLAKNNIDIDVEQLGELREPLFIDLRAELMQRRMAKQNKAIAAKFERLDREPWLPNKQIDVLIPLLDQLMRQEPTIERLVAKLRLPREKEAQVLFEKIVDELAAISKQEDHAQRREMIYRDLRKLHAIAIDLAAGESPHYGEQINEFVIKAEEYLAEADKQKFIHDMALELNENRSKEFGAFKDVLRTNPDVLQVLGTICKTLKAFRDSNYSRDVEQLSVYWLEHDGRSRYQALVAADPDKASTVIESSLRLLGENSEVLPEQIKGGFKGFLEKHSHDLKPKLEAPPEEKPPPVPDSRFRRFLKWITGRTD